MRLVLGGVLIGGLLLAGCGGDPAAGPTPTSTSAPTSGQRSGLASVAPTPVPSSPPPIRTAQPTPTSIVPTNLQTVLPPTTSVRLAGAIEGGDVSWPQCPKGMGIPQKRSQGSPMPTTAAQFIVIGLTNGPGFVANPCLAAQVQFARDGGLLTAAYAVASYPDAATLRSYAHRGPFDATTRLGGLQNVGYQQATYNVSAMLSAGLRTPIVWIDVEPVPDFDWSGDLEANAAVVQGAARGYRDAGFGVGVYSTPALWQGVVGGLRLGADVPEWRAAGHTSREEAVSRCDDASWSIQGGHGVLGQWADDVRDLDLTCPGVTDVGALFSRQ